jgi:hypothetical protein
MGKNSNEKITTDALNPVDINFIDESNLLNVQVEQSRRKSIFEEEFNEGHPVT